MMIENGKKYIFLIIMQSQLSFLENKNEQEFN